MKQFPFLLIFTGIHFLVLKVLAQENAAPSIHLTYYFPSQDAVLKMQKIKITQSAYASYFEVNSFTNGYAGLQQTPDKSFGTPNILISSLWDRNTAAGVYSAVNYNDHTTIKSRFGGEGDGWRTISPYNWTLNTWYNVVNRAWKIEGRLYIATFINNLTTNQWFHTATLSIPDPAKFLNGSNDAFLENWYGGNRSSNGRFIRKAYFKDCWNLNTKGSWERNTNAFFSANDNDEKRNGRYNNSFNAYFDSTEDAYCMQHGGNTIPSAAFNGHRTLNLPPQTNQGIAPVLTTAFIKSVTAANTTRATNVSWVTDELKAPQLSAKIDIIDAGGKVVATVQDTLPERRNFTLTNLLTVGTYTVRVTVRDIFDQISQPAFAKFVVSEAIH